MMLAEGIFEGTTWHLLLPDDWIAFALHRLGSPLTIEINGVEVACKKAWLGHAPDHQQGDAMVLGWVDADNRPHMGTVYRDESRPGHPQLRIDKEAGEVVRWAFFKVVEDSKQVVDAE